MITGGGGWLREEEVEWLDKGLDSDAAVKLCGRSSGQRVAVDHMTFQHTTPPC